MEAKQLLGWYQQQLKLRPIRTKAITSCIIALIGEVICQHLKKTDKNTPEQVKAARKRLFGFALFGLLVNGPAFHWWYQTLEKLAANRGIFTRLAFDRLLFSPPFLALTAFSLQYVQNSDAKKSLIHCKSVFKQMLLMNWKVWTVAQYVNFKYVPLHLRTVFGNMVALWWNIYLSSIN